MSNIQGIIYAIIIGICFAVQGPINSALGKVLSIKMASFHSILTSAVIMGAIVLFSSGFSSYSSITKISPLYWTGGILGIIVVFLTTKTIPVLGTASFFSVVVSVQIVTGALINNFGILGVSKNPINLIKVLGMALILVGVRLVVK